MQTHWHARSHPLINIKSARGPWYLSLRRTPSHTNFFACNLASLGPARPPTISHATSSHAYRISIASVPLYHIQVQHTLIHAIKDNYAFIQNAGGILFQAKVSRRDAPMHAHVPFMQLRYSKCGTARDALLQYGMRREMLSRCSCDQRTTSHARALVYTSRVRC